MRGYDRYLMLREWQETARKDPLRPPRISPDDWLRMSGFGEYATDKGIAEKRPDTWTKTP